MHIPNEIFNKLPTCYLNIIQTSGSQSYFYNFYDLQDPTDGEEYFLYSLEQLDSHILSKKYKTYDFLKEIEKEYYEKQFDNNKLPYKSLVNMFVIGSVNDGKLAINLEDKTLWVIYMDGFIRNISNSFEEFLKFSIEI